MEVNHKKLKFFKTQNDLRKWFEKNHATESELWIGMYRKDSGKGGVDYKQALDEALCYGWIDGIRKKLDADSFTQRFTPRRPKSVWSKVNIAHVKRLTEAGRMMPTGMAEFDKRSPEATATRDETRAQRLRELLASSARESRIPKPSSTPRKKAK